MTPLLAIPEFLPIDLHRLVAVSLSLTMVLIPVIGVTLRFAVQPVLEALMRAGLLGNNQARATLEAGADKRVDLLTRRVLELEQEVARLKASRRSEQGLESLAATESLPPEVRVR